MVRFLATIALLVPAAASAQDDLPVLAADAPITLRPSRELAPLAQGVARSLALRIGVAITVGDAPPPEVIEAIPSGHVAIAREGELVLLVLAGPEGQVFRSEVTLGRQRGPGAERAVALAVEALRDAALEGPPEGTTRHRRFEHDGQEMSWSYREADGGIFGRRERIESEAKPLIQLGLLGGLSTERLSTFLGPRITLGLCLTSTCLMLEGDVSVTPEVRIACDGRRLEYRPVTLGLRFAARPVNIDDTFSFALGIGILSRFGIVNLVGVDVSRLTTDFGVRPAVEIAWRVAAPIELALEVGVDVNVSPARFVRTTRPMPGVPCPRVESILVEDAVTVWAALSIRLRP